MTARPRLLLLGGGHSHLPVIAAARDWQDTVDVTLVSPHTRTAYSGMVPGVIAGHYPAEACLIDVEKLATRSRIRFVRDAARALDPVQRTVQLDDGRVLGYDLLSIDVGATPTVPEAVRPAMDLGLCGTMALAPCKPFPLLIERVERFFAAQPGPPGGVGPCVVGAGLAGIEVALALAHRSRAVQGPVPGGVVRLLAGDERLLPAQPRRIGDALGRACREAGVEVVYRARVVAVDAPGTLVCADGRRFDAPLALVATGACAPRWLSSSGLALDRDGFVRVGATLASLSHPEVFAAGDCASVQPHPRPRAGVYAVRQGPPLAANLLRAASGEAPEAFVPQRDALALVSLGPRAAIAIRNGFAIGGPASRDWIGDGLADTLARRLWQWKDRIDRTFVARW